MRTLKERRQHYAALERKGFTQDEIMNVMPADELKANAQKGGQAAIVELKRREALSKLHPMPRECDLDLGC